jgi:ParB/RepB/Spo0J family partition protein
MEPINQLTRQPVGIFTPSRFNAERSKRYAVDKLQKLGENIREHGQIQPVIARWMDTPEGKRLEIIAGERRWRGMALVGLSEVETVIKTVDDRTVCDMMLSENIHRENLTPVEKADIFADMLRASDQDGSLIYPSHEALSVVTNESAKQINRLIQMRNAPDFILEAVESGVLKWITAYEISTLATAKQREACGHEVLEPEGKLGPLTRYETRDLIQSKFRRSLVDCGFDPEDETLVPVENDKEGSQICGGVCSACPWFGGKMAEQESGDDDDEGGATAGRPKGAAAKTCNNIDGFVIKQRATWLVIRAAYETKDVRPISGDDARRVFSGQGGKIGRDIDFVNADDRPEPEEIGLHGVDKKTLKKWRAVAEETPGLNVVPALNPYTGKVHYLVPKAAAVKALKGTQASDGGQPEGAEPAKGDDKEARREKKAVQAARLQTARTLTGLKKVMAAITTNGVDVDGELILVELALTAAGEEGCAVMAGLFDLPKLKQGESLKEKIIAHVTGNHGGKHGLEAFVAAALVAREMKFAGLKAAGFLKLANHYGVNLGDVDAKPEESQEAPIEEYPQIDELREKFGDFESDMTADETPDLKTLVDLKPIEQPKPKEEPEPAKLATRERFAAKDQEEEAWQIYLETGSCDEVVKRTGLSSNTVASWRKRRGWVKQREEEMARA